MSVSSSGIVHLVGAGAGDLGLFTLRAKELISAADVLVYDYLVHPEAVKWCRAECEVIYVGKKAGCHTVPQDEIEALLVKHAQAGKKVVRLKGGDPFIFGRGGEEARTLAKAGVAFEIVPGVTAALAAGAYAGIPLTFRNVSTSLVFLTARIYEQGGDTTRVTSSSAYKTIRWRDTRYKVIPARGHLE